MRNISAGSCIESKITHFMFNRFFFESRVIYEMMWKKYGRVGQVTDGAENMGISWRIGEARIHTHLL
jgi:hypothetical protein